MSPRYPTTEDMVQFVLDTLDEGDATGRDGHPATHLAVVLDEKEMLATPIAEFDFPSAAHDLWERVNASDLTIQRFAADEEIVARFIEGTIHRVQSDALLDLSYLVRRHLRQPALSLSA